MGRRFRRAGRVMIEKQEKTDTHWSKSYCSVTRRATK